MLLLLVRFPARIFQSDGQPVVELLMLFMRSFNAVIIVSLGHVVHAAVVDVVVIVLVVVVG